MEWFWIDDWNGEKERVFNGVIYVACDIPKTGLHGYYCGQGDLRWV